MSEAYLKLQAQMAARQAALMQKVGLDTAELGAKARQAAQPIKPPRDRSKKRMTELIPQEGFRKSVRRERGSNKMTDEETRLEQEELLRMEEEQKREQRALKHGPREITTMPHRNAPGATLSLSTESLKEQFAEMARAAPPPVDAFAERDETDDAYEDLREGLQKLECRGVVRVVPERIYSLAVHPQVDKDLVFVGDKVGHMGLWDATDAHVLGAPEPSNGAIRQSRGGDSDGDLDDPGYEQIEGRHWHWRAHLQNTISSIKFRPHDAASVYSSAYDCTVRRTYFESCTSEEVLDADAFGEDNLVHGFDFTPDGREIWAVDNGGGLIHRDLRAPIETAKRWNLDRHKVGSVHLNPANPTFAITAHLKRYIRLWDLRKLQDMPSGSLETETIPKAMVLQYEHQKACSSAYFDSSGTKMISTSYDDCCRIWDIDPRKIGRLRAPFHPDIALEHNNQVGRCKRICVKAAWCPAPTQPLHFTVASMDRELEIYSPEGEILAALIGPSVTAVPAITASHPVLPNRYFGGTGSGKVSFFTTPWTKSGADEEDEEKPEVKAEGAELSEAKEEEDA